MTKNGPRTQKLGIVKIKDALPCACLEHDLFWEYLYEEGVPVFKEMKEPKTKSLKHLTL